MINVLIKWRSQVSQPLDEKSLNRTVSRCCSMRHHKTLNHEYLEASLGDPIITVMQQPHNLHLLAPWAFRDDR